MRSAIFFLACLVFVAVAESAAPANNQWKGNALAELPEDQRKCVLAKFQSSHEVLNAIKNCKDAPKPLDCVKAIPALKECFAA